MRVRGGIFGEEGGIVAPPGLSYRSISSRRGVASPAIDIGVLWIMGLGEGRGVILGVFCFFLSASFSWSHCSATLPQSTAVLPLDLGCCCGVRPLEEDEGVLDEGPWWLLWPWLLCVCPWEWEDWGVEGYCGVPMVCWLGVVYE